MPLPDLMDTFHKHLYVQLAEQITNRSEDLANGSAATSLDSHKTVAENYAAKVAYIQALRDVLSMCQEISDTMYGAKKKGE